MTDAKRTLIETPINLAPMLDGAGTSQKFFAELEACYRQIPDDAAFAITQRIGQILDQAVRPGHNRHVLQLALVLAVTANMSADLLLAIEPANPVRDPDRDGRVAAIKRFQAHVTNEAFLGRILNNLMQATGMA